MGSSEGSSSRFDGDPPRAGIHLASKPRGETSFSLVRALMEQARRAGIAAGKFPVCHGGALDPFAEGLLLLLAGPATHLMDHLHAVPKTYLATIEWGTETDNGDGLGSVVAQGETSRLTPAGLDAALEPFLGWTLQVPPAFSNKRVEGERAYLKARRGEQFEVPPARVYLHSARFVAHSLPQRSSLLLVCRGGYYVRSLARDLGRALGCRAHLSALRRTAIGPWEDLPGAPPRLLSGELLLPWLPSRLVDDRQQKLIAMNKGIGPGAVLPPEWPLPEGFPGEPFIRALHLGKLTGILGPDGETVLRLKPV